MVESGLLGAVVQGLWEKLVRAEWSGGMKNENSRLLSTFNADQRCVLRNEHVFGGARCIGRRAKSRRPCFKVDP
jgi:hypothetical protein